MTQKNKKYILIYQDFIRASIGEMTVKAVTEKYNLSRQRIYQIADMVESGKQEEYHNAVLALKWKYIYNEIHFIIKNLNTSEKKKMFGKMVRAMVKDDFSVTEIETLTGRTRKTISNYLNK